MKRLIKNSIFIFSYLALFSLYLLYGCSEEAFITDYEPSKDDSLSWYKKIAITAVHNHASMLGNLLKDIYTEQDKIVLVRKSIDSVRFYDDKSGYFYVYNFSCVNIAHATQKNLQDSNLYNHTDIKGNFVVRLLSEAAQKGGGFVEFYWIKPGTTGEKKKLGYVEPIPNTNYFIGTGVYME